MSCGTPELMIGFPTIEPDLPGFPELPSLIAIGPDIGLDVNLDASALFPTIEPDLPGFPELPSLIAIGPDIGLDVNLDASALFPTIEPDLPELPELPSFPTIPCPLDDAV